MSDQVAVYLQRLELPKGRAFAREAYVVAVAAGQDARRHELQLAAARLVKSGRGGTLEDFAVYPPGRPGEHVVVRLAVMDSAAGVGRAGVIVDQSRGSLAGTRLDAAAAAGVGLGSVGAASVALGETLDLVVDRLRAAGDVQVAAARIVLHRPEGGWAARDEAVDLGDVLLHLRVETGKRVREQLAATERAAAEHDAAEHDAEAEVVEAPPAKAKRSARATAPAEEPAKAAEPGAGDAAVTP